MVIHGGVEVAVADSPGPAGVAGIPVGAFQSSLPWNGCGAAVDLPAATGWDVAELLHIDVDLLAGT